MKHPYRSLARAAAPSAARYRRPMKPEMPGLMGPGPNPRAHRLEPLPGSFRPPRRPRRPAGAPIPAPRPSVLLYRLDTSEYLASLGSPLNFRLFSEPLPLPPNLTAYPIQYLTKPQPRYTNKHQCEAILQSPYKVFLSGLRVLEVPQQASAVGVTALFVGDYKEDRCNRELTGYTLAAIYGRPAPYDTRPGWLLLVVGTRPYAPKHRAVNARTAASMLRQIMPELRGWLTPLLAGETGPSESLT